MVVVYVVENGITFVNDQMSNRIAANDVRFDLFQGRRMGEEMTGVVLTLRRRKTGIFFVKLDVMS